MKNPNKTTRQEKIEVVVGQRQEGIVVLEDIHDPHNAAAVMRSCDAFGWQKVWFVFDAEQEYDPRMIGKSSSSSANKWLDFEIFRSTEDAYRKLKREGFEIVATALDRRAENICEAELTQKKLAVVFGNEHGGLSKKAIAGADRKIYVPMKGMVQSLNISVTAGIVLYEIGRQRKEAGEEEYGFDLKVCQDLVQNFSKR